MTKPHLFSDCPAVALMERIASRWTIPVLALISETPIRFTRLRRELDGVSQKMLSQTLKSLERDGIISRAATPTVPVTVEYALTPLGRSLIDAFAPLRQWSDAHSEAVARAQSHFDEHREPWLDTVTNQRHTHANHVAGMAPKA